MDIMCANHQRFCLVVSFLLWPDMPEKFRNQLHFWLFITRFKHGGHQILPLVYFYWRGATGTIAVSLWRRVLSWGCGVRRGWRWRGEAESSVVFIVPNDQWHPLIIFTLHCFGLFTSLGNLNVDNCILYQEITATEEIDKKCLRTCCCFITITILHY